MNVQNANLNDTSYACIQKYDHLSDDDTATTRSEEVEVVDRSEQIIEKYESISYGTDITVSDKSEEDTTTTKTEVVELVDRSEKVNEQFESSSYSTDTTVSTKSEEEVHGASKEKEEEYKDLTVKAGNRLYCQAMRQHEKHKEMRDKIANYKPQLDLATKSKVGQRVRSLVSRTNQKILKNRPAKIPVAPVKKNEPRVVDIDQFKKSPVPERFNTLYNRSSSKQRLGKERRKIIEEKKAKSKAVPETLILPQARAGDMYARSMHRLTAQRVKLAALSEEFHKRRNEVE
jgi:hypothetical protein